MAQFDVYLNSNANTRKEIPCLLDALATRVVMLLVMAERWGGQPATSIRSSGSRVRRSSCPPAKLAGVSNRSLGNKTASLKNMRDEIIAALDLLFTGI